MSSDYWARWWATRSSRRRFLGSATAASAGVAGLALVGCGDDDDDDDDLSGLNTATPDTQASPTPDALGLAKHGGVWHSLASGGPPTLDPYGNISFLTKGFAAYHYSRLFKYEAGPGIAYGSVRPTEDAAESAESTPDGLKWTVSLRKDVKFHDMPPVNGRVMTTEDFKATWDRATSAESTNKPITPVDKVEYPDDYTIVFTLKQPTATFKDDMADSNVLWLMPKEAFNGGFDPATIAIGSGPWVWDSYQPDVKFVRQRHAEWHGAGQYNLPFFDTAELNIVPEYANRLAQFRAGNVDVSDVNGLDLPDVVKDIGTDTIEGRAGPTLSFFFFDSDPNSPWNKDVRIRQAVSMAINRDDLTELGYNVKALRDAGIEVNTPWHNLLPAGETRWWLDPKSADQGPSAKFFEYNPAESMALLSAAGFPNGLDAGTYQYTANRYGQVFNDIAEQNIQYMTEAGIRTTTDVQDYSSKYITQTFLGNFSGIAFGYETPFPEAGSYLLRFFTDVPTNHSRIKDPALTKIAMDQAVELDEEARKELFWEAQRLNAESMYYIPNQAGSGTGWTAYQPNIRNAVEYNTKAYGAPTETLVYFWRDA